MDGPVLSNKQWVQPYFDTPVYTHDFAFALDSHKRGIPQQKINHFVDYALI